MHVAFVNLENLAPTMHMYAVDGQDICVGGSHGVFYGMDRNRPLGIRVRSSMLAQYCSRELEQPHEEPC